MIGWLMNSWPLVGRIVVVRVLMGRLLVAELLPAKFLYYFIGEPP